MAKIEKYFRETTASNGTFVSVKWMEAQCHEDLQELFLKLEQRGWYVEIDPDILRDYSSIAKNYFHGSHGQLQFKAHRYKTGFEIEFYQDVVVENKNGGKYDSDKLIKMPYRIKLRFIIELKYIKDFLISKGYEDKSEIKHASAYDDVMHRIKKCWHYEEGKEKPEYILPSYNATDKNVKQIKNGQVKYYRDYKGNLMRGTVYHNINNMWWTVLNKDWFTNIASFNLFDLEDESKFERKKYSRKIPHRIRAEKARRRFNEKYNYTMINELHINHLMLLTSNELAAQYDDEMRMSLKYPLKKDIKVLKKSGLQYAKIEVNGSYFTGREAITFNSNGFVGFAGWASGRSVKPFVDAFEKWLDWLDEKEEVKNGEI